MADTGDGPAAPLHVGAADGPWVELRIHGVSGTPPESMLESAQVRQVAGDAWGRFFRPVNGVGDELQAVEGRTLEGYHWGKYTSGSAMKGLWLILIPFGMVNAAAFMLPDPGTGRRNQALHTTALALIRGLAIGLTCTFALTAGLILVDLVGFSWASGVAWLSALGLRWTVSTGLLAAGAVLLLLFAMGNENRAADFDPPPAHAIADVPAPRGMSRIEFFTETQSAPILGRLHLAMGWSVLALLGALVWRSVADQVPGTPHEDLRLVVLIASVVLILLTGAIVVALGDPEQAINATSDHFYFPVLPMVSKVLMVGSGALLVACFVLLTTTRPRHDLVLLNPIEVDRYTKLLPTACTVVMFLLLVACWLLGRGTRDSLAGTPAPFQRYARGLAAWAMSSAGLFVGVGFCAAFDLGVGKLVGRGAQTDLIYRIAYVWGITAVILVAAGLAVAAVLFLRRHRYRDDVSAEYQRLTSPALSHEPPAGYLTSISVARLLADLKWYVAAVVIFFAATGTVMTVVTCLEMFHVSLPGALAWISQGRDVQRVSGSDVVVAEQSRWFGVLYNIGTFSLIAAAGYMFVLGRRALRTESARRGLNVVWDVISFWPHSVHPFVPPSYAQFAVRDLRRRIRHHLLLPAVAPAPGTEDPIAAGAPRVVLSAHSQGSLIAVATILWLSEAERSRVALVTYGSQLQVAFPRAFPAYVDFGLLGLVRTRLADRWINLYRETDPIAGPVLSWGRSTIAPDSGAPTSHRIGADGDQPDVIEGTTGRRESGPDWRVLDPPPVDPTLQTTSVTHLGKHSGYPASADYTAAVRDLLSRL
jgi:hypothetical protein